MNNVHKIYAMLTIIIIYMVDKQIKAVHFRFVLPQEDTIAHKEKISTSFMEAAYKSQVLLAAIIIASVLISIPSAYAVLTVDSQEMKVSVNHQPINSSDESSFSSNELLIKIKSSSKDLIKKSPKPEDTGIISLNNINKKHGASKFEQVAKPDLKSKKDSPLFSWYKISFLGTEKIITKRSVEFGKFKRIMESYKLDSDIEAVEPDYIVTILSTPNDSYYSSNGSWGQPYPDLWGIRKINPEPAWNQTTGSPAIIVAGIDTGVDRNHEDIKDNMWVNIAEIPNNGVDDDGNSYVDDYYGWDWANNDNDPMDDHGHGTHTAGTIAAVGNNGIGVVGVNWKSRIMALKFLDSSGSGYLSDGVKALQYAADMGAKVSSNSWGCMCNSVMMDDAVQYEYDRGMAMVAAAGNSNADALDFSPASADGAITVAASDYNDTKASFSNWGQKIDVAAPGVDILSTRAAVNPMCAAARTVGVNYCRVSGTSMATPHVAGLASLILSKNPALTNEEVRQIIRTGAFDLGANGKDIYFGYGRINASGSISISNTKPLSPIITSPKSRTVAFGTAFQIKGSVPGQNFESYKIEAGAGREPSSWKTLAISATQMINGTLATVDTTQLNDGLYIFRLAATDTNGKTYHFQVYDIEVDNFDMAVTSPVALVSQGIIDVLGYVQTKNGLPFVNYKIEWGIGSSSTFYSSAGIILTNNGTQTISSGKLASWDTSGLTDGQAYTLRLTVNASNGAASQYSTIITVDKDIVPGWPKLISRSPDCFICEATPTIADLNGDGTKEVIIASPDNKIYVFRRDGTDFPGFPVSITLGERFARPPNVADLDNDGKKEIIVASTNSTSQSKVYVISSDGTFYPGWSNPVHIFAEEAGDGTPTVADLDGDGKKELVIIDPYYKKMHAYHLDGTELPGFPKTLPLGDIEYPGAPLISDLDMDGKPEIAYGMKDKFYLFDNNGTLLPGWPFVAPAYNGSGINFFSTAASGDIDGDGNLEVFAIGHTNNVCSVIAPVYAWRKNGSLLPNWPMPTGYLCNGASTLNTPSIADVDNDGRDEIMVGLSIISIFDLEGAKPIISAIGANIQPAISDIDGDGKLEFAGVRYNQIKIGNSVDSIYWRRDFPSDISFSTPAVFADLDNNGKMGFGAVQTKYADIPGDLVAYLWELPNAGANPAKYEWPMFSHDPQRTGRLVISANTTDTISPITSIASPANGSTVSGTINVIDSASDNMAVSKVELYRNDALVGARTSSPFTFVWNTTQVADGMYTLQSKAYDAANNVGVSSLVTLIVSNTKDNTPPTVSITNPSDNSIVPRRSMITMAASASDDVGIAKVEFYVNGLLQCSDTTQSYTCNWNIPAKSGTTYLLQAKAYDAQGNVGSTIVKVTSK